jgi:hypothetical protein
MDDLIKDVGEPDETVVDKSKAVDPAFTLDLDVRKTLISAFILWQIFAVTSWLLPPGKENSYLMAIAAPYMQITGYWQSWTMFSPNPMRDDYFVQAQIKYADGTTRDWNIPRTHDMGLIEAYQKERYRKMIENAGWKTNKTMYPYLARYAMIENDRGPQTYPATVTLVRYWRYISPPIPGWRNLDFAPATILSQTFNAPVLKGDTHP